MWQRDGFLILPKGPEILQRMLHLGVVSRDAESDVVLYRLEISSRQDIFHFLSKLWRIIFPSPGRTGGFLVVVFIVVDCSCEADATRIGHFEEISFERGGISNLFTDGIFMTFVRY